jgi:hypothetical protein
MAVSLQDLLPQGMGISRIVHGDRDQVGGREGGRLTLHPYTGRWGITKSVNLNVYFLRQVDLQGILERSH